MKIIIKKYYKFTDEDKNLIETFIDLNKLTFKKFASLVGYPEAFVSSVINGKEKCEKRFIRAIRRVLHEYTRENK